MSRESSRGGSCEPPEELDFAKSSGVRTEDCRHRSVFLLWTDSVSDRSADADDVAGSEIVVVIHDVKEAGFRTKEHVSPYVVADAAAHIYQEMIRTGVAGAEGDAASGGLIAVEAGTLPSDSAEEIRA